MNDIDNFNVTDRVSFTKFLALLSQDILDNPEGWENRTLPDFLDALGRYTEDIQGYYDNMKTGVNADAANWSTFADLFRGARVYE